jgi:hypothetical protein
MLATRYEIKFLVSAEQKQRFLEAAGEGLEEDAHGVEACYRVSSQYFDSPDLSCYWEKVDGVAIRHKVRLRYYGEVSKDQPIGERPFFLEVKHRLNETIFKERLRLTSEGALTILEDAEQLRQLQPHVDPRDHIKKSTIFTVETTAALRQLVATNVITYRREAWQGRVDGRLRLTFDQCVHALPPDRYSAIGTANGVPLVLPHYFVMELKFDKVVPLWIKDIVAAQGMRPQRFSKYANGIEKLDRLDLRNRVEKARRSAEPLAEETEVGQPLDAAVDPLAKAKP